MTMRTLSGGAKAVVVIGALALSLTACSSIAPATNVGGGETVTLRLASPLPATGTYGEALEHWAAAVAEASDGEIEVEIYTSGSLLSGTDIMPGVSDGRADLGLMFSNYHVEQLTLFNAVATPFVSNNTMATGAAFKQLYSESDLMREQFATAGIVPLAFVLNGAASTGTRDEITTLSDLEGQRIRVPGTVAQMEGLVGVDAVFLELAELYEGVDRGVVDGWSGVDFASAMSLGLAEVTPHATDLGIGQYASAAIIVNPDTLAGLSAEHQAIINEVSARYPEALSNVMTDLEARACDNLLDAGGSATRLSDSAVEKFITATEDEINASLQRASVDAGLTAAEHDDFIERYRELMTSYDNPSGYVDGLELCVAKSAE
ncbi:TRAP transporter substrate-binding protein DctP [Cryobacterium sp. Y50]|uniref:TRAP transporter substrate-binding protein DctP n=1 Tax=Cryobacterium sp. Y50 TaxID=2048286 RepID=UPI000CE48CAD|nr:TRAP transporter substrate-binding protein DctP [Cryobacterium sp. Y50]